MSSDDVPMGVLPLPNLPPAPPQWPPMQGRRRFPSLTQNPTLISDPSPRPGRRLFKPLSSDEIETSKSPAERHRLHLLLCTTPTGTLRPEEDLVFLSSKRRKWKPVGGGTGSEIPVLLEDQFLTPGMAQPKSPPPKVSEPSARLLRGLKRDAPKPITRIDDGKKVNAEKIAERLFIDSERREKKRADAVAAKHKAEDSTKQTFKKLTEDDVGEFVARLVDQPLTAREAETRKLLDRFTPRRPAKQLTKEQQEAANKRLYADGRERIRAATARSVDRYVEQLKPKFAHLTEEQIRQSASRLSTPRALQPAL